MRSEQQGSVPARARRVGSILLYSCIYFLLARSVVGETITVNSYNTWQWNGFSRSSYISYVSTTPMASPSDTTTGGSASLSGVVYWDKDGDGLRDETDWGIRDVIVSISLAGDGSVLENVITGIDGSYTFDGLEAGEYKITVLSKCDDPETPSVGTIGGAMVGTASGQSSITAIVLPNGATGIDYDFPQLTYPSGSLSKRMLTNTDPGLTHTTPKTVPEPGAWGLLIVAGLLLGGLYCRRRS